MKNVNENWLNVWFAERGLVPYEYQKDIILNLLDTIYTNKNRIAVLAACPNAGKTLMSIAYMVKYLMDNPNAKILVLTHGTTILREQYVKEIIDQKPGFSHKEIKSYHDFKNFKEQVAVALPQSLDGILPKFDLIIVDEAHHFYFERKDRKDGMIQSAIEQVKPKHQILLTGSPSKFIYNKFEIIPVTVNQIHDLGKTSDLIIEMATTSYDSKISDFKSFESTKKETQDDINRTLYNVLEKIELRLKSILKNNPKAYSELNQLTGWGFALKNLKKTMIACKPGQAEKVKKYFDSKGIKSALSISETDNDSKEIKRFIEEDDCLILIVIFRGVLGFNMPRLENVIDLTGSQNIDRIFQLMCRVLRKHPDNKKKLFIKVAPHNMYDYYHHLMTATVCLFDEQYYTKYNGKNFYDMSIPVRKTNTNTQGPKGHQGQQSSPKPKKPIEFLGLPVFQFFKDLKNKRSDLFAGAEYSTLREIRDSLFCLNGFSFDYTIELIKEYINDSKVNPEGLFPIIGLKYKGVNIGDWCGTKRATKKTLTKEQIKKLESIKGWYWNMWDDAFEEFKVAYYKNKITYKQERWAIKQRAEYNKGNLSEYRIKKLESLKGWSWNKRDATWNKNYNDLVDYVKKHGKIPPFDSGKLGEWCNTQRQFYKKDKLDNSRIIRLEKIKGWKW